MCSCRAAVGRKKKVAEVPDNPVGEPVHTLGVEADRRSVEVAHSPGVVEDNLEADTSAAVVGHTLGGQSLAVAGHILAAVRMRELQLQQQVWQLPLSKLSRPCTNGR